MTEVVDGEIIIDDSDDALVKETRRYKEARANAKRWSEIGDTSRDNILETVHELGGEDARGAVTASGAKIVSVTETLSKHFDRKAFAADHPEIDLEPYMKPRVSIRVTPGSAV